MLCPKCSSRLALDPFGYCKNCHKTFAEPNPTASTGTVQKVSDVVSVGERQITPFTEKSSFYTDKQPVLIDYHNTGFKFSIIKGSKNHLPNKRWMKNWTKEWVETDRATIEKTTKSLMVFVKGRVTGSIGSIGVIGQQKRQVAIEEAQKVALSLGITIGEPQPMRKEIKVILPALKGAPMFQADKVKNVYPAGTPEFIDPKTAEKDAINFTKNLMAMKDMPQRIDTLDNYLLQFGQQLMEHLEAIKGIKNGVGELSEAVNKLSKASEKPKQSLLRRIFTWQ